ncbi:MAG: hypothetical protein AAF518_12415 [Spirochaetota bacterium]
MVKYFLFLSIFIFHNCLTKNANHHTYWKEYFADQEKVKNRLSDIQYNALYGNLKPENEGKLKRDKKGLFLAVGIKNHNSLHFYNKSSQDSLFLKTHFKKSYLKKDATYRIDRYSYIRSKAYTPEDFFLWLDSFKQVLQTEPKRLQSSHLYKFLCSQFRCSIANTAKSTSLSLILHPRIAKRYKTFYEELKSRLEKLKFASYLYTKSGYYLSISNRSDRIILRFPRNNSTATGSSYLSIHSNIFLSAYGLKISVKKLKYYISIRKKQANTYLFGYFPKVPDYSISGRLFYFLPKSVIDAFIPGDMDSYMKQYFTLLVRSKKRRGMSFSSQTTRKGDTVQVTYHSYLEKFQKPFRPFGERKSKREGRNFIADYRRHMVRDLKP